MRQLRFVGPGDDSDHVVVETADGSEQFSLAINEALRSAIRSDLPKLSRLGSERDSAISPREIQVRVRAGASAAAVAEEAGISVDRVMIFAGPVLQERARVAGEARRSRARRSTPDGQLVEFGAAVDERFAAHGIDPAGIVWDAHRRDDGQWVVSATWRGGDTDRTADWAFSLTARTVTPLDETAADLLSDRPIRPVVQVVPDLPAGPVQSSPDALTGPLPITIDDELFDQEAPADAAEPALDFEAPPLPLRLADPLPTAPLPPAAPVRPAAAPSGPPTHPEDEDDDSKAARARIPSWDDILLGVRRKRD